MTGPDAGDMGGPDGSTVSIPNAVYTMSNDAGGNSILVYSRDDDGSLAELDAVDTGGVGSGKGLGSQGSLVFDSSQNRFFAVNAGDNTISMLSLQDDGVPMLESSVDSGGVAPISITAHGDFVYVVNAGDDSTPANIAGFQISGSDLMPIASSSRPLSTDNPKPGQIKFSSDGSTLVVTEKATAKIDTFTVDAGGVATGPIVHPSIGKTPFGFDMSADGQLVVSEAFGGMDGKGAASSYELGTEASGLTNVSAAVESGQSAPCWVVLSGDYAYTTNTKTDNLTAYSVAADGTLELQWSADTGDAPIDAAVTPAGDYLYVLNAGDDSFSIYEVNNSTGALTQQPDFTGLSAASVGVAIGSKAVYTMDNDGADNQVVAYLRAADGSLSLKGSYSTGGTGSGGGLGSQGSLVLDSSQDRVFAVNAGDNSISMLSVESDGSLTLESNVDSGGVAPKSITVHGSTVYVVNAGDMDTPGNISGFQISGTDLSPITDSSRPLSAANPGPAQIQFNADGSLLMVTEKGTSRIDTYTVDAGLATGPNAYPSAGMTPFGFAITDNGQLVVSDAFGGMDNKGAASSYAIGTAGTLTGISGSVANQQSAPCWLVVSGSHAYVTNTKSDNVTGYEVAADGTLSLLWSASAGTKPIDEAVSSDDAFLYILNAGDHSLSIYGIKPDSGLLMEQSAFTGIPETAVGLVAR